MSKGGQRIGSGRRPLDPSGETRKPWTKMVTPSEKAKLEKFLLECRNYRGPACSENGILGIRSEQVETMQSGQMLITRIAIPESNIDFSASGRAADLKESQVDSKVNPQEGHSLPVSDTLEGECVSEVAKAPKAPVRASGVAKKGKHVADTSVMRRPSGPRIPATSEVGKNLIAPPTCGRGNPLKCDCLRCKNYRNWLYAN